MFALYVTLHFGLSFLTVVVLGLLQLRAADDKQKAFTYSLVANLVMLSQGLISILVYGGTSLFPFAALILAATILTHHTIIHWNSDFEDETCSCAPFQVKDVSNHETWVVASFVAAYVSAARI